MRERANLRGRAAWHAHAQARRWGRARWGVEGTHRAQDPPTPGSRSVRPPGAVNIVSVYLPPPTQLKATHTNPPTYVNSIHVIILSCLTKQRILFHKFDYFSHISGTDSVLYPVGATHDVPTCPWKGRATGGKMSSPSATLTKALLTPTRAL